MIDIGLGHYLTLGAIIFTIGIVGIFLNRKNVIVILMSIELILLAVNINLVSFSIFLNDLTGQIFTLFILTVAAAEAAIGLAMLAAPLLTTLFNYKAFSTLDVLMAGHSLRAYAIGLPAFVLIKVLSAGFFSRQDTKTPVTIGLIAVVAELTQPSKLAILANERAKRMSNSPSSDNFAASRKAAIAIRSS